MGPARLLARVHHGLAGAQALDVITEIATFGKRFCFGAVGQLATTYATIFRR